MNLRSKVLAVAIVGGILIYGPSFTVHSGLFSGDLKLTQNKLSLDATALNSLMAETGAGKLEIKGVADLKQIELVADVYAYDDTEIELSLKEHDGRAELISKVLNDEDVSQSPYIDLTLKVPAAMMLDIKDGSGSIKINAMTADIKLKDGSGSIAISGGRSIDIKDGSGSIQISDSTGALTLADGSGSINLQRIGGDVTIDDGSGSINVEQVQGHVVINDGSGSINVKQTKGLTVKNAGSGSVNYSDIDGPVVQ